MSPLGKNQPSKIVPILHFWLLIMLQFPSKGSSRSYVKAESDYRLLTRGMTAWLLMQPRPRGDLPSVLNDLIATSI